jgi:phosphate transport system substrate-binding protein
MMRLEMWLCIFAVFASCVSSQFAGIVANSISSCIDDVRYAYTFSQPKETFTITPVSGAQVISSVQQGNYSYGIISEPANLTGLPPNFRLFPIAAVAYVIVANLPEYGATTVLSLTKDAIAKIFAGEITMWNDPEIAETNMIHLPNATIEVVYRSVSAGANTLLTTALSGFSTSWTYGTVQNFPKSITANDPHYHGVSSNVAMFAKLVDTSYSIGYMSLSGVYRQSSSLIVSRIINEAGVALQANTTSLDAALAGIRLDSRGMAEFINPHHQDAWPLGHFVYVILNTQVAPHDCKATREMVKFFNWIIHFDVAAVRLIADGAIPLTDDLIAQSDLLWDNFTCNHQPILAIQAQDPALNPASIVLLVLDIIMIIVILFLTVLNLIHFRLVINVLYTVIFALGSVVLFLSPPLFMMNPSKSVCLARIWLASLGFSIVLGTMFSRTWQLREIYLLQKKKFDRLHDVSVSSSLVKLIVSMSIVVIIVFGFLGLWTGMDPFKPVLNIIDPLNLQGEWTCKSKHFGGWMGGLSALILVLILFGIYVIFQTWSFQRKALLVETKWVLFALYNIVLNLVAVIPMMIFGSFDDDSLVTILCTTIEFSGGGIVFAVMLPRIVNKLEWSDHSKNSSDKGKGDLALSRLPSTKDSSQNKSPKTTPATPDGPLREIEHIVKNRTDSRSRTPDRLESPIRLTPLDLKEGFMAPVTERADSPDSSLEHSHQDYPQTKLSAVAEGSLLGPETPIFSSIPQDNVIGDGLSSSQVASIPWNVVEVGVEND